MNATLLPKELFSAYFGLGSTLSDLQHTGTVQHSSVLTDFDGGAVRCLTLVWEKRSGGKLDFTAKYLFHTNGKNNHERDLIRVTANDSDTNKLSIEKVWLAPEIADRVDASDLGRENSIEKIADFSRRLHEAVMGRGEWINPVGAAHKAGLAGRVVGKSAMPGLYPNGEIQTHTPRVENGDHSKGPIYEAPFFSPVFGLSPENEAQTRSVTARDDETNTTYVLSHHQTTDKEAGIIRQSVTLTSIAASGIKVWPVYEMECGPARREPGKKQNALAKSSIQVKKIQFYDLGQNAALMQLRSINLADHNATNTALKSIRMLNRSIRAGQTILEDDLRRRPQDRRYLLPTDIFLSTGLFKYLAPADPSPKKAGRFTFRPIGGNNTREIFSSADRHIGANAYILSYYPPGETKADALMIDTGVLFHDEFDVTFFNAGKFLKHRDNPAHEPEQNVQAILFTHRHKDHVGQLAYLVKTGYLIPPLIMDKMSHRQLKREMDELDIDKKIRDALLEKCHIIDVNAPARDRKTRNGGVTIAETTESIRKIQVPEQAGFKLGSQRAEYEEYPVLQIGRHFKVHVGPMPHSAPGLCFHVTTPAGSHLHMGDPKLDDSILLDMPGFRTWLLDRKPDTVSVDCTGTTREDDKPTPIESEIRASLAGLLREHSDNRFICPVLGSNTARILTLVAAMGDAGRRHLIIDGKALEDTIGDLDKIHDIKKWAERNFQVTIAIKGTKDAIRILREEDDFTIVCAVTGTQDEMYSTLNRALRDWLPGQEAGRQARLQLKPTDIIAFLQGPIPVGDNMKRRRAAAQMAEDFHGVKVLLPELIADEAIVLAGSGHCGPREIAEMLALIKPRAAFLVHGGPDQLKAGREIVSNQGIDAHILDATQEANVSNTAPVTIFRSSPAELIGIHSRIREPSKFYLKGIFTSYVVPLKPLLGTDFGRALDKFEHIVRARCGIPAIHNYIETQIFSLSRMFNKVGINGYLAHKINFGIDKYANGDVLGQKNITMVAAFDTETTGLDASDHRITQFALAAWTKGGKKISDLNTDLRQKIPDYVIASPEALLVTATKPQSLSEGLHPVLFAEKIDDTFKALRGSAANLRSDNTVDAAKLIALAHNKRFDDRMINRTMAESLHHRGRPHHYRGIISMDTRIIARALLAYAPKKFDAEKYKDAEGNKTDLSNMTLGALCRANGLPYDETKAHKDAGYDLRCCHNLYTAMMEKDSEVVGQMIINADHSTGHLINDMTGGNLGFDSPHPVFSYVSPFAKRPDPQMGCFVSMLDAGRKAVVFNLKYNPEDYFGKTSEEIAELVADSKSDVFEIFDLKDQPIIVPARMGFKVRANGQVLKETLDRRASVVKAYTLYKDPAHNMTSFEERLDVAFTKNHKFTPVNSFLEPDMVAQAPAFKLSSGPSPLADSYSNFMVAANSQLHRTNRAAIRELKNYRDAIVPYLEADTDEARDMARPAITRSFREVRRLKEAAALGSFDILNIHYDLAPEDLSRDQQDAVLRYRQAHGYRMALDADRQWTALNGTPARLDKFGRKPGFLRDVARYIEDAKNRYPLNEAVREHGHTWRRTMKTEGLQIP